MEIYGFDTAIPYIYIRPGIKRQLKTPHSERKVPLTGASLFAFQQFLMLFNN